MRGLWRFAKRYPPLLRHWSAMLLGRSYWHAPQGLGRAYSPTELHGYHNDMTAKVQWTGPIDAEGIPLCQFNGRQLHFPTMLLQKALGHWDCWLLTRDSVHRDEFLRLARWAERNLDDRGGWKVWTLIGIDSVRPYAGMTQGEGISVLVRAHQVTGEAAFLGAARRALDPMLRPVVDGGTQRVVADGIILEEFPLEEHSGVLNGWVFAVFGLHDLLLGHADPRAQTLLESSLTALARLLPRYDLGYWSRYDLSGTIASPFYHGLHIAQLTALELTFAKHSTTFGEYRRRFEAQRDSKLNRVRAVARKAVQKLANPPPTVLQ